MKIELPTLPCLTMKSIRLLLCSVIALPFLAASLRSQAFGPIRYGMNPAQVEKAKAKLNSDRPGAPLTYSGADIRKYLVNDGAKFPAQLTEKDEAIRFDMNWAGPELYDISFHSFRHTAADYDTAAKAAWEQLRDIAKSKFGNPTETNPYPATANFTNPIQLIVTDTWTHKDVKITLGILAHNSPKTGEREFTVTLRARDAGK